MGDDGRGTGRTGDDASGPSDAFLIAGMLGGDSAALRKLMDRYDRLVRYAVFQAARQPCLRDPQWLDAVASATWQGFVQSMRRAGGQTPDSLTAFLARIARNQAISALRRNTGGERTLSLDAGSEEFTGESESEGPVETLARLELLEAVQACLAGLSEDDRTVATQLGAITERRWKEAAGALGIAESTLRSRWKQVLGRLRGCVEGKTGNSFAPGDDASD